MAKKNLKTQEMRMPKLPMKTKVKTETATPAAYVQAANKELAGSQPLKQPRTPKHRILLTFVQSARCSMLEKQHVILIKVD